MHSFIITILDELSDAVGIAVITMIIGVVVWVQIYRKVKKNAEFSRRQIVPIALLMGYLGGLVSITLLHRESGDSAIQWHLFRAFREAWNAFTLRSWLNPLLNVGMFVPLGVLLPLVAKPFRRWYLTLAAGACASLLIEALQYIFILGSADVDDLFCNILGTMLGFCLCMMVLSIVEKRPGLCAAYAVLPVLSAAVLAGTFIAYDIQPYGNLADAPAFAANTKDVSWVLECELSDEEESKGVYWVEPFNKETCDEFALDFAQQRGVDITDKFFDIEYWDNGAFYSNHKTFSLTVEYNDRTYEYHDYQAMNDYRGTATETELRAALSDLGIKVPETAEFADEGDGQYSFRADSIEDNGTFTSGELNCYVAKGGALYMVDNKLVVNTPCGSERVISQQEAYNRLRQGLFSQGAWFENRKHPEQEVHVLSCSLEYITDSKGFYQPVYMFDLKGLDSVFVPALAN